MFIIFMFLLVACQSGNSEYTNDDNEDLTYIWAGFTFSQHGIISTSNGPVRLVDIESTETIVLCDKPECRHEALSLRNSDSSCLAQIELLREFAIYRNKQVFLSGVNGSPLALEIYTADISGHNRKLIAEIEDFANAVTAVLIRENNFIFSYSCTYEITEIGTLEDLEIQRAGVAIVDLDNGNTTLLPVKEAYGAGVNEMFLKDGFLYYSFTRMNDLYDDDYMKELFSTQDDILKWEMITEYTKSHMVNSLIRYNLETREEDVLWSSLGGKHITGFSDNYATASPSDFNSLYIISLDDGSKKLIVEPLSGGSTAAYVNDKEMYYFVWVDGVTDCYLYDFELEYSKYLFSLEEESFHVFAVLSELIYLSGYDATGEFYFAVISKEDFLVGNYDSIRILFYPNNTWG